MRVVVSVLLVTLLCCVQPYPILEGEYRIRASSEGDNFQYSLSTITTWSSADHDDPCPNPMDATYPWVVCADVSTFDSEAELVRFNLLDQTSTSFTKGNLWLMHIRINQAGNITALATSSCGTCGLDFENNLTQSGTYVLHWASSASKPSLVRADAYSGGFGYGSGPWMVTGFDTNSYTWVFVNGSETMHYSFYSDTMEVSSQPMVGSHYGNSGPYALDSNGTVVDIDDRIQGTTEAASAFTAGSYIIAISATKVWQFDADVNLVDEFTHTLSQGLQNGSVTCSSTHCILPQTHQSLAWNGTSVQGLGTDVLLDVQDFGIAGIRGRPFTSLLFTDELVSDPPTQVFWTDATSISGVSYADGFVVSSGLASPDYDEDLLADVLDPDDDNDGVLDDEDACQTSVNLFISDATSDHDADGCEDLVEDLDDDADAVLDGNDSCPLGLTGWTSTNITDIDGDGCNDRYEDFDDDSDGIEDILDSCPMTAGTSTVQPTYGCPDADGDGVADRDDAFPDQYNESEDMDNDGVGDNSDAFPSDATQQFDSDGDGFGDNSAGFRGDACPTIMGNSSADRYGCPDGDGDGWSDANDGFPDDEGRWMDTDRDGVADNDDAFPFNPAQTSDRDLDGYGDNRNGGSGSDAFPDDPTQWSDIDGDGFGDNADGARADAFIADATQWSDQDGDGYGDNPTGRQADMFPLDATQWMDQDGDGLGDNQSGNNPDPFLFDADNDGYNDSIDPLPKLASPGDLDNDGVPDELDLFPGDASEWRDSDEDGIGDEADDDDDNDGWSDAEEIRQGTDPYSSASIPTESFEILVPGTSIGLSAWDLMGIFGGVPLFFWLLFGFVTRTSRAEQLEEDLRNATTRDELESVAKRSEFALMIRLLGPHQAIRLE